LCVPEFDHRRSITRSPVYVMLIILCYDRRMNTISLLTLNCFGIPGWGTHERLERIAHELNEAAYTLACLQEVHLHPYRELLTNTCRRCYPSQAHYRFVHAPKGGLLTLSRLPILHSEFIQFHERLWYSPDWLMYKGILLSRLRLGDLPVVVLNTHLSPNFIGDWQGNNPFVQQEGRELAQIAEVVNQQPADALVILCGDFNVPRGNRLYHTLIEATNLIDPLAQDRRPTYRPYPGMNARYAVAIDFILYRAPALLSLRAEAELCFAEKVRVAGRPTYLSDHLGVQVRLSWG
jgi:endonuclease/exonuclease/phosphatase family metal-dependent hydrolase